MHEYEESLYRYTQYILNVCIYKYIYAYTYIYIYMLQLRFSIAHIYVCLCILYVYMYLQQVHFLIYILWSLHYDDYDDEHIKKLQFKNEAVFISFCAFYLGGWV